MNQTVQTVQSVTEIMVRVCDIENYSLTDFFNEKPLPKSVAMNVKINTRGKILLRHLVGGNRDKKMMLKQLANA